jgi:hypothetical protein
LPATVHALAVLRRGYLLPRLLPHSRRARKPGHSQGVSILHSVLLLLLRRLKLLLLLVHCGRGLKRLLLLGGWGLLGHLPHWHAPAVSTV